MRQKLFNVTYMDKSGPLPETIGHFWTMIWQQQVSAIVMLCRLTESGICKCARYWPATTEEDDLIHVPNAGLEVRLRDFDDQDKDFSVRQSFFFVIFTGYDKKLAHLPVQPFNFAYIRLLNKPYENKVTLTGQNPHLKF